MKKKSIVVSFNSLASGDEKWTKRAGKRKEGERERKRERERERERENERREIKEASDRR